MGQDCGDDAFLRFVLNKDDMLKECYLLGKDKKSLLSSSCSNS